MKMHGITNPKLTDFSGLKLGAFGQTNQALS
jgi:hypothetical protein